MSFEGQDGALPFCFSAASQSMPTLHSLMRTADGLPTTRHRRTISFSISIAVESTASCNGKRNLVLRLVGLIPSHYFLLFFFFHAHQCVFRRWVLATRLCPGQLSGVTVLPRSLTLPANAPNAVGFRANRSIEYHLDFFCML